MKKIPSLKTLRQVYSPEQAKMVREKLTALRDLSSSCFNASLYETMQLISSSLGCFGVEEVEEYALYVNVADSYKSTLMFNRLTCDFIVSSMGEFVEYLERKGIYLS